MTLDGWGDIGRVILEKTNIIQALFLCFYIFIMNFFFMNILLGVMLDIFKDTA